MALMRMLAAAALAGSAVPTMAANYVVIRKEVWQRVGDFCAIGEWMTRNCEYSSGSGDVGTIRVLDGATEEPMVAKTAHSYTYGQTKGGMSTFAYYGTLAVEPAGAKSARLIYTIVYDAALMPSDEVRKAQAERIGPRFETALQTMKKLAEAKR
jgi:hypothetical protein